MKILFFIANLLEPYRFYVFLEYQRYFQSQKHQMDILIQNIPPTHQTLNMDFQQYKFTSWDKIQLNKYNIILITGVFKTVKLDKILQLANLVKPKKVYYVKSDFRTEFYDIKPLPQNLIFCFPSQFYSSFPESQARPLLPTPPPKNQTITFPVLGKIIPSHKYLITYQQFITKYKLHPTKKICLFLPGAIYSKSKFQILQRNPFYIHFDQIIQFLNQNNIQFIYKLKPSRIDPAKMKAHQFQYPHEFKQFLIKLKKFPNIEETDYPTALLNSKFALTTITSTVNELYLYNLPCLDFGSGHYFFRWGPQKLTDYTHNVKLINQYFKYQHLFGHVVSNNSKNIQFILEQFLTFLNSYPSPNSDLKNQHPMWGDTYNYDYPPIELLSQNI